MPLFCLRIGLPHIGEAKQIICTGTVNFGKGNQNLGWNNAMPKLIVAICLLGASQLDCNLGLV